LICRGIDAQNTARKELGFPRYALRDVLLPLIDSGGRNAKDCCDVSDSSVMFNEVGALHEYANYSMLELKSNKHTYAKRAYASPMETMGDRIKLLRESRKLTQAELGKLCDVTGSAVSQWETGLTANIKLRTFLLLAHALRTDFEFLVYGPDRKPTPTQEKNTHKGNKR
jgi:DNA-binding transcriptional regulator YiaG